MDQVNSVSGGRYGLQVVGRRPARQVDSVARYTIATMVGRTVLPIHVWTREEWRAMPEERRPADAIRLPNGCVTWAGPQEAPSLGVAALPDV